MKILPISGYVMRLFCYKSTAPNVVFSIQFTYVIVPISTDKYWAHFLTCILGWVLR